MKTKIDFKVLDFADIEFGTQKPSIEDQKAFSEFLIKRKKKLNQLNNWQWEFDKGYIKEPVGIYFVVESKDFTEVEKEVMRKIIADTKNKRNR